MKEEHQTVCQGMRPFSICLALKDPEICGTPLSLCALSVYALSWAHSFGFHKLESSKLLNSLGQVARPGASSKRVLGPELYTGLPWIAC